MAQKSKRRSRRNTGRGTASAEAAQPSWWERLPASRQHLICVLLLLAVSLGFFAPLHFSGMQLVPGDTVNWRAMAEVLLEYEEQTGEIALWAPNAFAGMPGYMISYPDFVPQLDDISTLLRSVLWPTSHVFFLLLGTYLLLFLLTRNTWSGVLAACAYGLTTYLPIILVAGHNTKLIALCFAPWLVLAFAYVLRNPSLLGGLLFAIALAVNLRADHVQITYYFSFLLGVWWIVEGVRSIRAGEAARFGKVTGWLALGAVLGLLMVAQPYLANYEYKDYTIRGAATGGVASGGLDWTYAMRWSQGIGELVTLVIADAYGGGAPWYWGPKPFTAGPHYVGGIVFLLAILALWRVPRTAVWSLGIGGAFMTLFALGEHLEWFNRLMFDYFPLFSTWRVPETWLSAVAFVLAVLAGIGVAYVSRKEATPDAEQAKTRSVYIATGAALGVVLLLFVGKGVLFDFEQENDATIAQVAQQIAEQQGGVSPGNPAVVEAARDYVIEQRVELFNGDALRTLLFLVLAGAVLILFRRGVLPAWAMQVALVLLVVVDLWGVGRRYFSEDDLQRGQLEQQIPTYDFDQYLLAQRQEAGGLGAFRVFSMVEGDPTVTARPSYHYESIGGYHGAKLRLIQDYFDHLLFDPQTGMPNENALDLLNIRYVAAQGPFDDLRPVYRGEQTGVQVLENPDALPRASFVGEVEVIDDPEAVWDRLRDLAFDPHQTAILPEAPEVPITPIDSASVTAVALQDYTPDAITWQVETDAPRLLVVSEIYYPAGWRAYLDGEEVPILRADYLLRAVPVPAGEHTLVMRFEPRSHTLGLWITWIATILVYGGTLVLLGLAWAGRREHTPVDVEATEPGAA